MSFTDAEMLATLPVLGRYARRRCARGYEDLVQSTLLRALEQRDKFVSGNLRAWLMTVMHNVWVTQLRTARNQPLDVVGNVDVTEDYATAAVEDAAARVVVAELRRALAAVNPDQRRLILARALDGENYEDMMANEGVPMGTI